MTDKPTPTDAELDIVLTEVIGSDDQHHPPAAMAGFADRRI